jgi:hypothetical protein
MGLMSFIKEAAEQFLAGFLDERHQSHGCAPGGWVDAPW